MERVVIPKIFQNEGITPLIRSPSGRENVVVLTGKTDERGCKTKEMTGLDVGVVAFLGSFVGTLLLPAVEAQV